LAAALCLWQPHERRRLAPVLGLAVPIWVHGVAHLLVLRTHYIGNIQSFATETWSTFSVVAPALLAGTAAVALWLQLGRRPRATPRIPWYLVCLVVALGLSAYGDYRHGWPSSVLLSYYGGAPLLIGGGIGLLLGAAAGYDREPALQLLFLLVAVVL